MERTQPVGLVGSVAPPREQQPRTELALCLGGSEQGVALPFLIRRVRENPATAEGSATQHKKTEAERSSAPGFGAEPRTRRSLVVERAKRGMDMRAEE